MPGQPAARVGDKISCSLPNLPVAPPKPPTYAKHTMGTGNKIKPPGCDSVEIEGEKAARLGDVSLCDSPEVPEAIPNPIIKGALTVLIGGQPAARKNDLCSHPGSKIGGACATTVLIGSRGCIGNPWDGEMECEKSAEGRRLGRLQADHNCALEATRQVINKKNNSNVSEADFMKQAIDQGLAEPNGGATARQCQEIMRRANVASQGYGKNLAFLREALSKGRGVVAGTWSPAHYLDPAVVAENPSAYQSGGHAVVITGAELDGDGNITHVYMNDSGAGTCSEKWTVDHFMNCAQDHEETFTITDDAIW